MPDSSPAPPLPLAPDESANFVTHRLLREGELWRYRPTRTARLALGCLEGLGWVCAAAGLLVLGGAILAGLAALAAGAGLVLLARRVAAQYAAATVIDTRRRHIDVVATPRFARTLPNGATVFLGFEQVAAVEIVAKRVEDTEVDFTGHELNLVLVDGRRYNVVDHRDGELIGREARTIAGLLGVEVRDFRG